jgi:MerR family transcriptional regulator, copper efflux regulator
MRIGELAARTNVSVRAIRYYERATLLRATRHANGYRDFSPDAVGRVRAVRDLLDTGFTIDDVVALADCLECSAASANCCESTRAVYRTKLARLDAQILTLARLRGRIEQRMGALATC